jgi:hypothetical protein
MKKNVLIFGMICGVIISSMMIYGTSKFYDDPNFKGNDFFGYASMIVAFSFIYVGVRNYRNKYNMGAISFGKAFKVGLFIALIGSSMYVGVWLIDYYLFVPDFIDKYTKHVIDTCMADGLPAAEVDAKLAQMASLKEMYKNPLLVILITYAEILPIGLIIALISALILKRKKRQESIISNQNQSPI